MSTAAAANTSQSPSSLDTLQASNALLRLLDACEASVNEGIDGGVAAHVSIEDAFDRMRSALVETIEAGERAALAELAAFESSPTADALWASIHANPTLTEAGYEQAFSEPSVAVAPPPALPAPKLKDQSAATVPIEDAELRHRKAFRGLRLASAKQTAKDGVDACDALYALAVESGADAATAAGFAHHIHGAFVLIEGQLFDTLRHESVLDTALTAALAKPSISNE